MAFTIGVRLPTPRWGINQMLDDSIKTVRVQRSFVNSLKKTLSNPAFLASLYVPMFRHDHGPLSGKTVCLIKDPQLTVQLIAEKARLKLTAGHADEYIGTREYLEHAVARKLLPSQIAVDSRNVTENYLSTDGLITAFYQNGTFGKINRHFRGLLIGSTARELFIRFARSMGVI